MPSSTREFTIKEFGILEKENLRLTNEVKRLVKAESALYEFQEKLDVQIQIYRKLYEIGKQFNTSYQLTEILDRTTRFVIYELNFQRCLILFKSDKDNFFTPKIKEGYYDADLEKKVDGIELTSSAPALSGLFSGLEFVINTGENKDASQEAFLQFGELVEMDEYVIFPLGGDYQTPAGFLIAGNTSERARFHSRIAPDSEFIFGLGNLVSQATTAINNARLVNDLKAMDKLKDEFLANTSHELRTPLNGIIGIAESLVEGVTGALPAETNHNLSIIAASGRRLSSLVNDILDFSKLRHKNITLRSFPVDLASIVDVVVSISQPLIDGKNLELINQVPRDLAPALADEDRLQQILHNLVGNAIKFTDSGHVEITAEIIELESETVSDKPALWGKKMIAISVRDTGIGIDETKTDRIFESFEQADGSSTRSYGGSGLGLSITKQLVALHGGTIEVNSRLGEGATFTFTLPVSDSAPSGMDLSRRSVLQESLSFPHGDDVSRKDRPGAAMTGGDRRILVVDDEPVNRRVLVNHLSLNNYAILEACSGAEALAYLEEGIKPDLILLDVMMPHMNGYEVTRQIRKTWQLNELPILLLTAKNQLSDLVAGLEAGANDFLTKPVSVDELLARTKTHIQIKELTLENLRMRAELDVTRRLQQMILPRKKELKQVPDLDIDGFMLPADEVGGDYFDVLQKGNQVKIGIGDVTGHGLESGLLMIMLQTAVRVLQENDEIDPARFLNIVNRLVYNNAIRIKSEKCLSLSILDYSGGSLRLSGQHEDAILVRNDGSIERIDTVYLGFPLGLEKDITQFVRSIHRKLHTGDGICLFTDGVTEAENRKGEQFGTDRLCAVLKANWKNPAEKINRAVMDHVMKHIDGHKIYDDITLLVIKRK